MALGKRLKKIIKLIISRFGYEVHNMHFTQVLSPSTRAAISRCKNRDTAISTVIDVGASNGHWAKMCMEYYPNAYYLLIENQLSHEEKLARLKKHHRNMDYIISAVGNKQGKKCFDASFGTVPEKTSEKRRVDNPITTIDYEVFIRNLPPPFLIKTSAIGSDISILEGAQETLSKTNLLILETYNYKPNKNCLKFYDICKYLEKKGFYPIDIAEVLLRNSDYLLWQMNIFFVQSNRKEFSYDSFE